MPNDPLPLFIEQLRQGVVSDALYEAYRRCVENDLADLQELVRSSLQEDADDLFALMSKVDRPLSKLELEREIKSMQSMQLIALARMIAATG
jgi:hypothetical protein